MELCSRTMIQFEPRSQTTASAQVFSADQALILRQRLGAGARGLLPSEVAGGPPSAPANHEFSHNAGYGRVTMRGLVFNLSGGLCELVRRLHEASLGPDPWLQGKQLLWECGYRSNCISDAFKRHRDPCWRELVEGNGRGLYRLNLRSA
jgi:hypothetical protein